MGTYIVVNLYYRVWFISRIQLALIAIYFFLNKEYNYSEFIMNVVSLVVAVMSAVFYDVLTLKVISCSICVYNFYH